MYEINKPIIRIQLARPMTTPATSDSKFQIHMIYDLRACNKCIRQRCNVENNVDNTPIQDGF
ncbi:hypothetical protein HanRHA438_Chr04g0181831 [Helianthus annuus]|nr:hypothetical protein HanRHA438_Chr04g0181831 [Helianthus annuus]